MPKNKIKRKVKNIRLSLFKSLLLFFTVFISTFLILEFLFNEPVEKSIVGNTPDFVQNESEDNREVSEDIEYGFAKIDESLFKIKEEDNTFPEHDSKDIKETNEINETNETNEINEPVYLEEPEDFPEPVYSSD